MFLRILSRVPIKSIAPCHCLPKPWPAMLSHPHFFNTLTTNPQRPNLMLVSVSGSLFSAPLTFSNNGNHVFDELSEPPTMLSFTDQSHTWSKVLASFGGLVLLSDIKHNIFLINPATREIKQLPPSPFAIEPVPKVVSPCGKYAIVKDNDGNKYFSYRTLPPSWYPVADHTAYALGYDSVTDDYKVVTLSTYEYKEQIPLSDVNDMLVNIYSVKNGTWTKADTFSYSRFVRHITPGVFVNGSVHWVASEDKHGHGEIVAFDLAHEKFHEVARPHTSGTLVIDSVLEVGDCLCLTHDHSSSGTEVWILKEYGNTESWTNFILVDPEKNYFMPVCLLDQEQMVLVKDPCKKCHKFVKYDMGKGTFKDLKIHGISEDFQAGGVFFESLVSPHCSHETC